jgi:hypothetical protein
MAILNVVVVAAEVLIWDETNIPTQVLIPAFIVFNTALAGIVIYAFVTLFAPKFQRFPDRLRYYATIDVPSLPAVAARPEPRTDLPASGTPA